MVLLSNDNNNTIKQNHILKCLEQKKMFFNIFNEMNNSDKVINIEIVAKWL